MTYYSHNWPENQNTESETKPENEVEAFTVAVPNLAGTLPGTLKPRMLRDSKRLLNYASKLDGFLGIHPAPPNGTLLIFKTENDAKRARNLLASDLQVMVGTNITKIYIPEQYAKGGQA